MLTPSAHLRVVSELQNRAVAMLARPVRLEAGDFMQTMMLLDYMRSDAMRQYVAPFPAKRIADAIAGPCAFADVELTAFACMV